MSVDYRWQSLGGILLDSTGDIALSEPTGLESLEDMIRSRLKAAVNGWQLYAIGANLQSAMGTVVSEELEITLQRLVASSLTNQFLQQGDFQVATLAEGDMVTVFVYINSTLIATAIATVNQPPQVSIVTPTS